MTPTPRRKLTSPASRPESFSFSSSLPYADKGEYIDKSLEFTIHSIEFQEGRGFDGGDRWLTTVESDDGRGKEYLSFGCNEKRDEQMKAAASFIRQTGPIRNVRLRKAGNAYYFENSATAKT